MSDSIHPPRPTLEASPRRGWLPPLPGQRDVAPEPRLPPFRVHHLLIWIACSSVVLAIQQGWRSQIAALSVDLHSIFSILGALIFAIGLGAHLLICLAGVGWRRQGFAVPNQPGHWIALHQCAYGLAALANMSFVLPSVLNGQLQMALWFVTSTVSWTILGGCFAYLFLVATRRFGGSWRIAFYVLAIGEILAVLSAPFAFAATWRAIYSTAMPVAELLITVTPRLILYASLVCTGFIGLAAWCDYRRRTPRGWAHWLAVSMWLVDALVQQVILVQFEIP